MDLDRFGIACTWVGIPSCRNMCVWMPREGFGMIWHVLDLDRALHLHQLVSGCSGPELV